VNRKISFHNLQFTIQEANRRKIHKVLITRETSPSHPHEKAGPNS
jgi:CBS domain containing-hemolysin-like protein